MTKKIFAEELLQGDVILIPASSFVGQRFYKIVTNPAFTKDAVQVTIKRMRNRKTEDHFSIEQKEFGRKVELELIIQEG
jgi:hypothetical protein